MGTLKIKSKDRVYKNEEEEFQHIGLIAFFDVENDKNIDWEKFFQLSKDEVFYAANNNMIIQDDKNEDQIWNTYSDNG